MSDEDLDLDDAVIDDLAVDESSLNDDDVPIKAGPGMDCRRKIEDRLEQMRLQRQAADYDF